MGTMTLSMITPIKTLHGPWARMESMIQLRISVNEVSPPVKSKAEDSSYAEQT
jgi:hypothetical protein